MNMTWDNYVLYLASIPNYEDDDTSSAGTANKMPETKNMWDLF